jgi:hypothetical protein
VSEPRRVIITRHPWDGQAGDMRSTLQTWHWPWAACERQGAAVVDFTQVQMMEPWALTLFTCFALEMRRRGARVELALDDTVWSNRYIERMGIREVLETGRSTGAWDDSNSNTGLHVLRTDQDIKRFRDSALALGGELSDAVRDTIGHGMAELGRNVIQHAGSKIGGVALAQRFPKLKAIQLAICDCGQGVLAALRPEYPEIRNELEALRLAILPHTSGARPVGPYQQMENMGLGLFITKEIALRTGGSFWLVSGAGLLGQLSSAENGITRTYRSIEPWSGTLAVLHMPDSMVVELSDLLRLCGDLALQAQRDASSVSLEFLHAGDELDPDARELAIRPIEEDVQAAHAFREQQLRPALESGKHVVLDFGQIRFATTAFLRALLFDVLNMPGVLTRLSFRGCTRSTEAAIRTVAALAKATYRPRDL